MRRFVQWARFVRYGCIGLLSGLDLFFGLRGCRVYVGLFSGIDLLFGLRGCRVHVGGSGGGSIRCEGGIWWRR